LIRANFNSEVALNTLTMKVITVLGAIAVVVLFFFGLIFAMAASVQDTLTRLTVSLMLFITGAALAYYLTRKPKTVIQKLEISGQMKAAAIKCPNCSASVDANQIKIVQGVPYATCTYCGNTFEVTEEPKW
jgi:DNA-directed RNA polymerase subunit RPC12/RpoP